MIGLRTARRLARVSELVLGKSRPFSGRVPPPLGRPNVLIVGIYIGAKPNLIDPIVEALRTTRYVESEQRWACMTGTPPNSKVAAVTKVVMEEYAPKWPTLESLLSPDLDTFDFVLFVDDDIALPNGFLDKFISAQQRFDFALAQPARTWNSYSDWPVTRRRLFTKARETRFVEIGPITSMDRRFLSLALPFSRESPMGWGYDLVWPKLAAKAGLSLGVIDAVSVEHSFRARSAFYSHDDEDRQMWQYLKNHDYIGPEEASASLKYFVRFP